MQNDLARELEELIKASAYRQIKNVPENVLNLSSNDYLGIASDINLRKDFLTKYEGKLSNPSARLLSNDKAFDQLERTIESKMGVEKALLFNSGYHANVGIYSTFVGSGDVIFCDKLNHASIIDGIKLGGAKLIPYKHLDYCDLKTKLQKYRKNFGRAIIASETLFSMDGDYADLHELIDLKKEFDCALFLDEAHTFGVYGRGMGYAYELGLTPDIDLVMGTFGKAIGSYGAFCAGSKTFVDYLTNFARPFIFSTTFPPLSAAFSKFILEKEDLLYERGQKLLYLAKQVRQALGLQGEGYIVPVILGANELAVRASEDLIRHGYYALPIRYPTVAKNSARVRLSLSATMEFAQLEQCISILKSYNASF